MPRDEGNCGTGLLHGDVHPDLPSETRPTRQSELPRKGSSAPWAATPRQSRELRRNRGKLQ